MRGYRINPNKDYVDKIIQGLEKKNGHCPCKLNNDDTILCPCDEFIRTGVCKCKLYIPIEEAEKYINEQLAK